MAVAGAAMVLDGVLYSVLAPLLPHYKEELGLTKAETGVLAASYALGTMIMVLPAAALANRINVRKTIVVGLVVMAAASIAVGLAHHILLLDVARFAQGAAGGALWSGVLAWASGLSAPERRGAVLGTITGISIAGALLGPPVGAVAVATSPGAVFSVFPVLALGLAFLVLQLPDAPSVPSARFTSLFRSSERRGAGVALWLVTGPALALGLIGVLGPLRLNRFGAGAAAVAATFTAAAIAEALVNPLAGRGADRFGGRAVVAIGLPLEAGLLALLLVPHSVIPLAVVIVLALMVCGLFWAPAALLLTASTSRAGISDAYAFALYSLAWAAGQAIGASGGAAIAGLSSDAVPCILLAVTLLLTLAVLPRRDPAAALVRDREAPPDELRAL
jgi:MFS family permease